MKTLLLPFLLIVFSVNAQQKNTVDLNWKISDTITYKTVMKEIIVPLEDSETQADTIFGGSDFFKNIQEQNAKLKYETKLYPNKNGNIDITMFMKEDKIDTTEIIFSEMRNIMEGVVLRGKVSTKGELLSFYYESSQKNLIAILFELPEKAVKVGDEWSLNINLIEMNQNFEATTFYKKNKVRLEEIVVKNGDKIAVIKYDIEEYVSGIFGNEFMTMFGKSDEEIYMKTTYTATGLFSINKGSWIKYDGVMEIDTSFSMMGKVGKNRTEFKLIPEN